MINIIKWEPEPRIETQMGLGVCATAKPKSLWRHYSEAVITCTYVERLNAVRRHVSQLYATSEGGGRELFENVTAAKCGEN